jgi:phosphoribosylpyrophosphate synthetase
MAGKADWELFLCSGAEHMEDALVRAGYSVAKSERNFDESRKFANSDVYTAISAIKRFQDKRVCVFQSFTCSGEQSKHNFTTGDRVVETLQVLDILTQPRRVEYVSESERRYHVLKPPKEIVLFALHLPFSKQDQIYKTGETNACHTTLRALLAAGASRIVTIDPHVPPDFTWFRGLEQSGKVRTLSMYKRVIEQMQSQAGFENIALVSTPGKRRSPFGHEMQRVDKTRVSTHKVLLEGEIDENLKGQRIFLIDDMVISGTTIKSARKFLLSKGASDVHCWITHALPYANGKEENLRRLVDAFDEKIHVSNTVRSRTFQVDFPHCCISCVDLIVEEFLEAGE